MSPSSSFFLAWERYQSSHQLKLFMVWDGMGWMGLKLMRKYESVSCMTPLFLFDNPLTILIIVLVDNTGIPLIPEPWSALPARQAV